MSHVFHRTTKPLTAVHAEGCWIYDADGKAYLDGAGGAIVNSIGHGDPEIAAVLERQALDLDFVHAGAFTSEALESYAGELAPLLPMDAPRLFPTSGGSEAVESALKLARAFHLARGEDRDIVISRDLSYHGNTLGALDLSGRPPLRGPYESWLGRSAKAPRVTEFRCPAPTHPQGCAAWHAGRLEELIETLGSHRVAAFIAEPVGGATSGAAAPPEGYWEAIAEVCRSHGMLLIVDEVMTGFGRTGAWFGMSRFGARPDIMTCAKGVTSGYWPFGLCVASGQVFDTVSEGFIHGFTYSHFPIGAAVAHAVLRRLVDDDLVARAAENGAELRRRLDDSLEGAPGVGDVRGVGMMLAVELCADAESKSPFPRERRVADAVTRAAREQGLLVYPSTGCAGGLDGDLVMVGPPFVIDDVEMTLLADRLRSSIESVMA